MKQSHDAAPTASPDNDERWEALKADVRRVAPGQVTEDAIRNIETFPYDDVRPKPELA